MTATDIYTNPFKMIQTIVTLHLHVLQGESHVLCIQTWSLCISIWRLCISHLSERWHKGNKETLLLTSWVLPAYEIFFMRWAYYQIFWLKGMNLQTGKLNLKQWLIRWVMLPQGWVNSLVVLEKLEELHDLCSLLPFILLVSFVL